MAAAGRPLRLVLLLEDLDAGGTQRYALYLATHIDRSRFKPEIWTLRGGSTFAPLAAAAGIPVSDLTRSRRVGPVAVLRLIWRLLFRRPDILYTLTIIPNIWGRLFGGLLRIPVVSGYRSLRPAQLDRLLHPLSRRIIANAPQLKDVLTDELGVPAARVSVVPNGVDLDRFSPVAHHESETPLIVCVARLVPPKDLPTLVAAFAIVRAALPEARLTIIGEGPVALAPATQLSVLPARSDVPAVLARAWVFALSSIEEGAPNAILEAMASGLPVVATDAGGIRDVVEDGMTGVLVPRRDPQALATALLDLLRNRDTRRRMGEAGRRRAEERYSIAAMVRATEALLDDAAGGAAPGSGGALA
ncbi:MAG TPA: glycosyltransferase [Beijerinckiaceae bacterium]|nr:glycosyltransferase [Beijerinckiaceae bacterium]